jgi:hypothetical protein
VDKGIGALYGFPMTSKTRPLVLSLLDKAVRDRSLPYVTDELLYEMSAFVEWEHGTSPRAQEGANDDLVMAMAVTMELYRRYGTHLNRWTPERLERKVTARVRLDGKHFAKRYGRSRT